MAKRKPVPERKLETREKREGNITIGRKFYNIGGPLETADRVKKGDFVILNEKTIDHHTLSQLGLADWDPTRIPPLRVINPEPHNGMIHIEAPIAGPVRLEHLRILKEA